MANSLRTLTYFRLVFLSAKHFGGEKREPEIRLRSQAKWPHAKNLRVVDLKELFMTVLRGLKTFSLEWLHNDSAGCWLTEGEGWGGWGEADGTVGSNFALLVPFNPAPAPFCWLSPCCPFLIVKYYAMLCGYPFSPASHPDSSPVVFMLHGARGTGARGVMDNEKAITPFLSHLALPRHAHRAT